MRRLLRYCWRWFRYYRHDDYIRFTKDRVMRGELR